MAMYERLLSTYQLVAFQETKFVKQDSIQTNEHFIFSTDSGAQCFWSDTTSPVFNERHGVGLVLSSASPFQDVRDLTSSICTSQLKNRYLLLQAKLGDDPVFIHVVYAPDEPAERGEFFRLLPTVFDGFDMDCSVKHIVVGDFNVTLDNYLDQKLPGLHHPGTGREDLHAWLDALGLMDSWRHMNPDGRDYTSPKRKNRLDYCFLTVDLVQEHLDKVCHTTPLALPYLAFG
uniref:Endonuclease/exonuclease/phosphatase domain-containing protein n=1 Tax=Peronospora matthiolae TaxID=2874970 RepID=A0AAV1UIZ0_9STRA